MKRILVIALLATMLIALLVGCKSAENQQEAVEAVGMGIANPMHGSSQEEIHALDGVTLSIPKASTTATWMRIYSSEDSVLDQVTFEYGSAEYCYRAKKTKELQDISGMYYNWTYVEDLDDAKLYTNEHGQGIVLWFAEGASYSLSMSESATAESLEAMFELVWNGQ